MAQATYTPISLYYSTTAAAVPTSGNLVAGELALNTLDEKLYFKNSTGTVKLLASNATTTNVASITFGTTGLTPSTATTGAVTVAGTLATTNGGTGLTSFTANGVVYASSTSALATGSALTFDGTNLGLGVTPSTWNGYTALQIKGVSLASNTTELEFSANAYYNAGWKYYASSVGVSRYEQYNSVHAWYNAPSGTAGNAITFTQAMTLDASGNLLVGTTSGSSRLNIAAAKATVQITSSTGTNGAYQAFTNTGGNFYTGLDSSTGGDFAAAYAGVMWHGGAYPLIFGTSNTERARINSSGNLLLGTTAGNGLRLDFSPGNQQQNGITYVQTSPDTFTDIYGAGTAGGWAGAIRFFTSNSATAAERARIDSSGNLLVGATATSANAKLYVKGSGSASAAARFYNPDLTDSNFTLYVDKPSTTTTTSQVFIGFTVNAQGTGSGQINANGASQAAFGSFSDARLKENIVDLTPQLSNLMALRPVEFDYKDGSGHQTGFVAQEMQQVYSDAVGEQNGFLTVSGYGKTEARLIKAIQEQQALIESLTTRLTALEGKA
jgi:hypothetical protein